MEYFVLTSDNDLPFVYGDAKFQPIDQGVYSNLWHGRKLPARTAASITLIKSEKKLSRDLFSVNAGFVGSKKLLTVLESGFRSKFEPVPADVYYHSGEKAEGEFFFLEFDCWVDAFDYENSRFVRDDDEESKVVECDYFQVDSKKTDDYDLFFLLNVDFFEPIVSKQLADALKKEKISGFKIVPAEEFTWSE
ncbi:Imm43 family immunity protein [Chromobacterium violaceum]|uniref:Imm43 family immunity protein n=1 Tax=Chromobacterium violaceum TaxID=536 RepID=UPI001B336ED4|nr:DUF1629 domain-containing protein [Chromobacterium violaceum]MBP4045796.1 hypothetical protein [Chromobacterium violaceum]